MERNCSVFFGLLACILAACAAPALADGKIFTVVQGSVDTPDQRAIISYQDGRERLIIESSFRGPGKEFAWVVPLPAVPKIGPASRGIFPTLRILFPPHLEHFVLGFWKFLLACVAALFLTRLVFKRMGILQMTIVLAVCVVITAIAIPSMLGSLSMGQTSDVTVFSRNIVGSYDTAVISATGPKALRSWLDENGFVVPSGTDDVAAQYIKEGWVFAAAKLRTDKETGEPQRAHPLAFDFPSGEAVYPLRLTAVDNGPCEIELHVFGTKRAEIAGFEADYCSDIRHVAQEGEYQPWLFHAHHTPRRIAHPGICGFTSGATVVTRLKATLTPEQMKSDAVVRWVPYRWQVPTLYSTRGALTTAANYAVSFALVSVLIISILAGIWNPERTLTLSPKGAWKAIGVAVAASGLLFWGTFSFLPITKADAVRMPEMRMRSLHREATLEIARAAGETPSEDEVRGAAKKALEGKTNLWTDLPIREEDSPGNYTLRVSAEKTEYIWYDHEGGPNE